MANVIIGIHGLGNKPPKDLLEQWWKEAMIEGLKANSYNTILPKFELVYWADILHDKPLSPSEIDEDSRYYLREPYTVAPKEFPRENHNTRKKIVDFVGNQINKIFLNEDLSLNYSSLTDVIVRKYFRDLDIYYKQDCSPENESDCKAKELINQRLIQVLAKYQKEEIMLLSHSMGSIIAFEVLNFDAPLVNINSFITLGSPLGLPVVISKIAAEKRLKFSGDIYMNTPPSVKKHWYNFSDIMDNVAVNYKLTDDFQKNEQGIKPIDFLVVNNYEIRGKRNPHKSYGYLRTPEFAKVLNEYILSEKLSLKQRIIRKTVQIIKQIKADFKITMKEEKHE